MRGKKIKGQLFPDQIVQSWSEGWWTSTTCRSKKRAAGYGWYDNIGKGSYNPFLHIWHLNCFFEWTFIVARHRNIWIYVKDLRTLFDRIDLDGSDNLDLPEIVIFFKSITDDLSIDNIERIFKRLDDDGNKVLDFVEFKERNICFH